MDCILLIEFGRPADISSAETVLVLVRYMNVFEYLDVYHVEGGGGI